MITQPLPDRMNLEKPPFVISIESTFVQVKSFVLLLMLLTSLVLVFPYSATVEQCTNVIHQLVICSLSLLVSCNIKLSPFLLESFPNFYSMPNGFVNNNHCCDMDFALFIHS